MSVHHSIRSVDTTLPWNQMTKDSCFNYSHLTKSHHALYLGSWIRDELPHEEIEVPGLQLDDEDDSMINQNVFGFLKSQKKAKDIIWKDLDLQKFLNEDQSAVKEHNDKTILKKIDNLHEFENIDQQSDTSSRRDVMNSQTETIRSSNLPSFEFTTPNVSNQNRTAQRNQNYQTPAARILR